MDGVSVADCRNVGSRFVDFAVNEEASGVGWACAVAADDFAVKIHCNHVGGFQQTEVDAQG